MNVSLADEDLYEYVGFALQEFDRPSGRLRSGGYSVPGVDGFQTQLSTPLDRDSYELRLEGFVKGSPAALRSFVLGTASWRTLVFSDQSPAGYQVQGAYVDEGRPRGGIYPVTIGFTVSPPCLLGADVTAEDSPVDNPGDYACPAVWTIEAAGDFALTVGGITATWAGGAGTVVINAETYRVTLDNVEAPPYLSGGYPWLLPGENAVSLTAGSTFSCTFNPRYA